MSYIERAPNPLRELGLAIWLESVYAEYWEGILTRNYFLEIMLRMH